MPSGLVIRKCDVGGVEIAGATLTITDLSGNVLDTWISVAGQVHQVSGAVVDTAYCLTEVQAPTDYALAESIYFKVNADGTVSILTYQTNADGSLVLNEDGDAILLTETKQSDSIVTMVDEYIGLETTTTEATTTTTTTTTTDSSKKTTANNGSHTPSPDETTTTTTTTTTSTTKKTTTATTTTDSSKKTTANNGSHTPSPDETTTTTDLTTTSGDTTTEQGGGSTTTTAKGETTTTTTTKGGSSSSSSSKSSSSTASSPKTKDALPALLIPAGLALAALVITKKKKK